VVAVSVVGPGCVSYVTGKVTAESDPRNGPSESQAKIGKTVANRLKPIPR
jgi:hypothetical protein